MRKLFLTLVCVALVGALSAPASAVVIDWITVGNPANACEIQSQGCFGTVSNAYRVSRYETTNIQYAEFLNAVADTDTNGLYDTNMGEVGFGGIDRSGSTGSYVYSAISERGDLPVNFVSFYSSLRFANWLHNGQPVGAQGNATTEDGAYTITPAGIAANSISRNAGATIFLTSEEEWYKAAYYDAGTASYFEYPAASNTQPTCTAAGAVANTANCDAVVSDFTDVGSYTGASSSYGTSDQGGNALEWNEAIIVSTKRGLRGGSFIYAPTNLAASYRIDADPTSKAFRIGFRVASVVPEPATGLLIAMGMLGLATLRRHPTDPPAA